MPNNVESVSPQKPSGTSALTAQTNASATLVDSLIDKISRRTMMQFSDQRRNHFLNTIAARARANGIVNLSDYVVAALAPANEPEMQALIDELTINETTFFRNVPQINVFTNVAIPEIIKRKTAQRGVKRLEIWSAACSTGQEVYTLAIRAYEALKFLPTWDVKVWGTDISPSVLEVARRGVYPRARLDTMPPETLARYFETEGDNIRVKDILRHITSFREHNLNDPFPPLTYDIIFCRNVMIYFSREDQARLAQRFTERLAPGGFLFIGHSESLQGLDVNLRCRLEQGSVVYQKAGEEKAKVP